MYANINESFKIFSALQVVRLGSSSYKKKRDRREQADPEGLLSKYKEGRQILFFTSLLFPPHHHLHEHFQPSKTLW